MDATTTNALAAAGNEGNATATGHNTAAQSDMTSIYAAIGTTTGRQGPAAAGSESKKTETETGTYYFFYGSLMDPNTLSNVVRLPKEERPPVLVPATLEGYKMVSVNIPHRSQSEC